LPLGSAHWAISTIRDHEAGVNQSDARIVFAQTLRAAGFGGRVAVTTNREAETPMLLAAGADLVLDPFQDGADRAIELLESDRQPVRLEVIEPDEQKQIED
ncbi:MAG: sodium:proton exchanger, partial [Tistlia sp.]